MPTYLMESFAANPDDALRDARERAIRAAEIGIDVRYVRTTFLPGEQTLLHVFEAASPGALEQAVRAAQLSYERIVDAVEGSPEALDREQAPPVSTPVPTTAIPRGNDLEKGV